MQFKGTGVALVTPFHEDGSVDEKGLRNLVDFQIENGTNFLVVHGSTGEAATLNTKEKEDTLSIVIDQNGGKLPIVVGMADNDTTALVGKIKSFERKGVDGILSASPHYNKPSQNGIIEHFRAIAKATDIPIILYNVPGRTGSNMEATTTLELAKIDNIVGVKEASGDVNQVMEILKDAPTDFAVLSGEDALTLPFVAMGAHGVISVVANALPNAFSTMVNTAILGDLEKALPIHFNLLDITKDFFAEGNPSGVKYCLQLLNICNETVRLPLTPISGTLKQKMEQELNKIKG